MSGVASLSALFSGEDWPSGSDEKSKSSFRGVVKAGFRFGGRAGRGLVVGELCEIRCVWVVGSGRLGV